MPEAHGPIEAGQENEAAVEPGLAPELELTPQDAGADLDAGLELGLAGAGFRAASRAGDGAPLPAGLRARAMARVQRHQGNFAAQRMLKRTAVQRALPGLGRSGPIDHNGITPPDNAPPKPVQPFRRVQRKPAPAGEDDDWLAERIEDASGGGQPLEPHAQAQLEAGLHSDLGDVRVHTDGEAAELAGAVEAVAFTSGRDIFFGPGTYQPGTSAGLELLAHEAAHTVQQASGPVSGSPAAGGVLVSDPADPFEQAAERAARAVTQASSAPDQSPPDGRKAPLIASQSIQRADAPTRTAEEEEKLKPAPVTAEPAQPKKPEELV